MSAERKPTIINVPGCDTAKLEPLPEDRKPTIINLQNQGDEPVGQRGPHILHLEDSPAPDAPITRKLPTIISVPHVVQEAPLPARTPTLVRFLFENNPASPPHPAAATILKLPGAEIRKRLKVSDGDIAELFPDISEEIREKARVLVISTNVDSKFTQTCGSWGQESQRQMMGLSEVIAKFNSSQTLADIRAEMNEVYDFFVTFKARMKEDPRGIVDFLAQKATKTAKQRFEELLKELEEKTNKLAGRLPKIQQLQLDIAETSGKLSGLRESMQVDMIAGQLIEFRGMLGEVKADKEFLATDLEILKSRIDSLRASVSNIEILRDQLKVLYLEVVNLQTTIQNTLLVEVPDWRMQVSLNGFEQSGSISSAGQSWSFVDQLIQKLKSKP